MDVYFKGAVFFGPHGIIVGLISEISLMFRSLRTA